MRYMLVNVSQGNLQVDLRSPEMNHNANSLHRPGKVISLNIKRGESVNLLPHFDGSIEAAHVSVKYSRDVLNLLRPHLMHTYVCGDDGKPIEIEKLLGKEPVEEKLKPKLDDVTKPDLELAETLAAQDQFEAKKSGEANEPEKMEEEDSKSKSKKKKTSKKGK
jgi:hypothetical protein